MKDVFVESNWVFEYVEPEFGRKPAADRLLQRAIAGEITLHVPAICLREGAESVRRKRQARHELGEFRRYSRRKGTLGEPEAEVIRTFLESFDRHVADELSRIDERLDHLQGLACVDCFALSDDMLQRVLTLRRSVVEVNQLKPFDEAILAAVLIRSHELRLAGATSILFCTLDADLLPWNRSQQPRRELQAAYDAACVSVLPSFAVPED
jgi:predicted nucleic acid-binding protein